MALAPGFKLRKLSLSIALCTGSVGMLGLGPAIPALANPAGATVVHGSASFMQDGGLLQIDNSPGAIINWSSFSIAQDEITRFQQQSAQSAVLNRVTGGEISEIFGQLTSNGHVFLINPNGMVFGQNATIDTAGFVASTLDITNQDFLNGEYRFAGDSGRIINNGYLTTRSGNVYFFAPDIENAGIIHAESGALVLAAGRSIRIGSLDAPDIQFEITAPDDAIINLGQLLADQGSIHAFAGTLQHSGAVRASGAALAEDGSIIFYADGDIDLQAGSTISASGAQGGDILVQSGSGTVLGAGEILAEGASGDGGRIRLLGEQVGLLGQARVSAEGSGDGGEILIGGNLTGLGPEPNAKAVFIGTNTRVSASSTDSGDGGTIIAYADDLNRSYGTLTARGGPNGGDGGFIETSAAFIEVTRTPDAGASKGAPGRWLIDPDLLVIAEGGLNEVTESPFLEGFFTVDFGAGAPTIQNTLIEAAIDGGTSVSLQTAGNAQSVRIEAPLTFNATDSGLFLEFDTSSDPNGNIFVLAPIINLGPEALDYFFRTEGFVDFGADVDTGGLLGGEIEISTFDPYGGYGGYGGLALGEARFSGDVTLRGNIFFGDTTIDGPFVVLFESEFVDLSSLTLTNGSDLSITGSLFLDPFLGSGQLSVNGSTLEVGGDASFLNGSFVNADAIFNEGVDALDLVINASNVDFLGGLDAFDVAISNGSAVSMDGFNFVETLTVVESSLVLFEELAAVSIAVIDGELDGVLAEVAAENFLSTNSNIFLNDLFFEFLAINGGEFSSDGMIFGLGEGASTIEIAGGDVSFNGFDVGTIQLSGGTLSINDVANTEIFDFEAGVLGGEGSLAVFDIFFWSSGTLRESVNLFLLDSSSGFLETSGTKALENAARLDVEGALLWFEGPITMADGAIISLNGSGAFEIDLSTPQSLANLGGSPLLTVGALASISDQSTAAVNINVITDMGGTTTGGGVDLLFSAGGLSFGSFEVLEGSRISFGGGDGGSHLLSGAINGDGTIRFTDTTVAANQINSALYAPFETIVDSGRVDFNFISETERLLLSGGAIGGNGQLIVTDRMDWTGGSIGVTGTGGILTIDELAVLEIAGPNDKFFNGNWELNNFGFASWVAGDIVMSGTPALVNRGTLSTAEANGPLSILFNGGFPLLINAPSGTLELTSASDFLTINADVESLIEGIVLVDNATVRFGRGGAHLANYLIQSGSVEFAGTANHSWQNGLNFTGGGFVEVSSGNVFINAGTVSVDNLLLSGGTIAGNGDLLLTGEMQWTGGAVGISANSGSLIVGADAVLNLNGAGDKLLRGDWTLENLGEINWFGGNMLLFNNAQIVNEGVFTAFLINGQQSLAGGADNLLVNSTGGQFVVDSGAGNLTSSVFTLNDGIITINNSLTRLLRGSTTVEGRLWRIGAGSTLRLEDSTHVAQSGVRFEGAGTLQVNPGAALEAEDVLFVDNLLLNGGLVGGIGETLIEGSFIWNSGTIGSEDEFGDLTLLSGSSALLTTAGLKVINGASLLFDVGSTAIWDGGEIQLVDFALLQVLGDFTIRTDSDIASPDETGFFGSQGAVTKDTTIGTTRFLVPFANDGSLTALSGTISLERDGIHFGDFFVLPPAEILFIGDHQLFGAFENLGDQVFTDATMTIDGPFFAGNVIIRDFSNITFNGTYTAASTSILNNSTAEFLFAASTGDLTVMSGSDIQGPGTLTVTGNAMIDQLLLTRPGDTVFNNTSMLVANNIFAAGPGRLSLNGSANVDGLVLAGTEVSVGGNLQVGSVLVDSGGVFTGAGNTQVTGFLDLENSAGLTGGRIDGAGNISVQGEFRWVDGVVAGTGVLDIAPGGRVITNPGALLTVQDRTLRNRSDLGFEFVDVQLALNGTAVLDNQGRMSLEVTPETFLNFLPGPGMVLNSGSFEVTASGSNVIIPNRFDNSGSVTLNSGFLRMQGGGMHSGSFLMVGPIDITTSGRLRFGGNHVLSAGSALLGGSFGVDNGTTTINGTIDLDAMFVTAGNAAAPGRLIINSDADLLQFSLIDGNPQDDLVPMLSGSGNISVANAFFWDSGTIGGTGSFVIADTAQVSQFGLSESRPVGTPIPLLTLSGRTFSTAISDALLDRGRLQIVNGGVFENSGGFTFGTAGGSPFTIEGGTGGIFRNTGTLTGASGLIFGTTTQNSGTLQVPNLSLATGMTLTQNGGSITTPGTFDVRGTLTQQAGTLSAGTIQFPAGGSAMLSGTLTANAAAISGGSLGIGGTANIGMLGLSAGNLGGPGVINVSNRVDWIGGAINGVGTLNLGSASTGTISGAGRTLTGFTLNNAGTLALGSNLALAGGATLRNTGTLNIAGAGGAGVTLSGSAAETLDNGGSLVASTPLTLGVRTVTGGGFTAPTLTLSANTPMSVIGGSMNVAGTFAVAGDLMLLGGSLAATTTNVTGSIGGIGTVTGNLNNSGILSPGTSPGEFTIDGNFTQSDLGTLVIEFDGDVSEPGVDFDLLTITGSASFDGTLELIALEGFSGTFGTSFQPITYASATGGFARIVQPGEGIQFTPMFGPNGLTAEVTAALNPDGTANIDTDNPPIPIDREQAELFADAVARSRGTTQEKIETTNTTVTLSNEQQQVEEECAEHLDRPDATGDSTGQGVGCRSM
ncbi:MAG: filamentous hemagglutinin N-terminal domain-containing protein [Gammaproteobacteria bacterium]|nr:filamentous hemagglutinin N-terminal domain-containing protein [Gammaproteobacteria bacterium]